MPKTKLTAARGLALVLALAPAVAHAQSKTPDDSYREGEKHYNLGEFQEAVAAFKQAFALETVDSKKSAYIYNIAQSYRYAKDCGNAQFFYKRFLALRDADKARPLAADKRADIEARIKELEECARQQEAIKNKPPDTTLKPDDPDDAGGKGDARGASSRPPEVAARPEDDGAADGDGDRGLEVRRPAAGAPRRVSLRLVGGAAKVSLGDLDVPIQVTGALIGGYPVLAGPVQLELGAALSFTPVPFKNGAMGSKELAQLFGVVANVGASYAVAPRLSVRGDLGVGILVLSGASESPLTEMRKASGALSMAHVRAGVSADYAITPSLVATVAPIAFSYSPAKEGLAASISAITALDFMVGLGYRM
jgi:tetratricopeptide (TPR) repeat protein